MLDAFAILLAFLLGYALARERWRPWSVARSLGLTVTIFHLPAPVHLHKGSAMDMKRTEIAKLAISPKDDLGNPAPVVGVAWALSPPAAGTLTVSETGTTATFVPTAAGPVTVSVTARNALGADLTDLVELVVIEPTATALHLSVELAANV